MHGLQGLILHFCSFLVDGGDLGQATELRLMFMHGVLVHRTTPDRATSRVFCHRPQTPAHSFSQQFKVYAKLSVHPPETLTVPLNLQRVAITEDRFTTPMHGATKAYDKTMTVTKQPNSKWRSCQHCGLSLQLPEIPLACDLCLTRVRAVMRSLPSPSISGNSYP